MTQCLMKTYGRIPQACSHGEGIRHAHPQRDSAIGSQAVRFLHAFNIHRIPELAILAARPCSLSVRRLIPSSMKTATAVAV